MQTILDAQMLAERSKRLGNGLRLNAYADGQWVELAKDEMPKDIDSPLVLVIHCKVSAERIQEALDTVAPDHIAVIGHGPTTYL